MLMLLPNDERFVAAFFGAILVDATPVPMPWPFGDADNAIRRLQPRMAHAHARAMVTVPDLAMYAGSGCPAVTAPDSLPFFGDPRAVPSDPAFIQYTSGSLGQPRGAVISHRAAIASASSMGHRLGLGESDVAVSWLPLFHDMGLVGTLLSPLVGQFPLHLQSPGEFLLHPARWLRLIADVGGTVVAAPDFAWRLLLRRVVGAPALPTLRHALDGAEPVHRSTIDGIANQLGVRLTPVYGLAEHTLGVAFASGGEADAAIGGRSIVSVGVPLPGTDVRIINGEIQVSGASQMDGYFRAPSDTAEVLSEGWLKTGDLGLVQDGLLYVTGREKDLVIQNGTKFHPYDIERVAADAAGSPPNGVAAFAHPGTEALVVVVESRRGDVLSLVRAALVTSLGVRADRLVQVFPGEIPRTSSGKVQRRACAERWADT